MSFQTDLNSIISSTNFDVPDTYPETNIGFWIAILIFSLVDSKIIIHLMAELHVHLQIFHFSTHHKKNAKGQITTTNLYSNPYLMSGSSLFLYCFYWTSDGGLERKANSFLIVFFIFLCDYIFTFIGCDITTLYFHSIFLLTRFSLYLRF